MWNPICISVPHQFTSSSGVGLYFEGWVLGQLEFWIFTDWQVKDSKKRELFNFDLDFLLAGDSPWRANSMEKFFARYITNFFTNIFCSLWYIFFSLWNKFWLRTFSVPFVTLTLFELSRFHANKNKKNNKASFRNA